MNYTDFKSILETCIDKYGFTCFRKNHYFQSGDLLIVINTQKSGYDNSYYVNYGFCAKAIHPDLKYPRIAECDIIGRFSNTASDKADLFQISEFDPNELHNCFDSNMQNIIMPVIEGGISRYFEIFPHAIHSAKRTLKEYLNVSAV